MRLPLLLGCHHLCIWSSEIAGFFDHQYLEMIIWYLGILRGDIYQGKVASENVSFGWLWPGVPLVQSDCIILWSSVSLQIMISYLSFLHEDNHQGKVGLWILLLVGFHQLCFLFKQVVAFLDVSWRN